MVILSKKYLLFYIILLFQPEAKPYATLPVMYQPFPPYQQFIAAQAPASAPIHYPAQFATLPAHTTQPVQRPTQTEQPKVVVLGTGFNSKSVH